MHFQQVFIIALLSTVLLSACQKYSDNQETANSSEFTQKDSTEIIQNVLQHKRLDSLLSFAFKGQTLKIVTNSLIKHPLKLTMNNKPVEFTQIDSSSNELRVWNKPKFYAKITILRETASGARLVIFFEGIGLFGEYELQKDQNRWKILSVNFART